MTKTSAPAKPEKKKPGIIQKILFTLGVATVPAGIVAGADYVRYSNKTESQRVDTLAQINQIHCAQRAVSSILPTSFDQASALNLAHTGLTAEATVVEPPAVKKISYIVQKDDSPRFNLTTSFTISIRDGDYGPGDDNSSETARTIGFAYDRIGNETDIAQYANDELNSKSPNALKYKDEIVGIIPKIDTSFKKCMKDFYGNPMNQKVLEPALLPFKYDF